MLYKNGSEELERKEEEYRKAVEMNQQLKRTLKIRAMELGTVRKNLDQISLSHKKEKDLLHENSMLQEEIAMLRLELDIVKHQNQLKEKKYFEDIESVKEEHDNLLKAIKLNEEAKTVFQYNGQLNILTTENKMLSSELKNVKYIKE
ncbi:putative ankyrin repeat domain-containing protein 26-like 1 [Piliocolobus tephrosceles]|uniref:putative ankyrin repeat domain-containing protein 26-like 1 n=1 Tax=Piliocolobus tephrosceles TaxID=591936 RepID=UPI0013016B77|nr:putative ankyrin repeat domain-containing protein 26-like 1 [Piliocolobus tephrosceles]